MPLLSTLGGASLKGLGGQTSTIAAAPGQNEYTSPGTYNWTAPVGVDLISVVCVGAGGGSSADEAGGGGGGGLAWKNNIRVIPGSTYTITVGSGGIATSSGQPGGRGGNSSAFGVVAYGGRGNGDPRPGYGGEGGGFANADGGGIGGDGGNGNLSSISDTGNNQGGGGAGGYGGIVLFDFDRTPYTASLEVQVGPYTSFGNGRLRDPEFGSTIAVFGPPRSNASGPFIRTISTNSRINLSGVTKLFFKVNAATSATWGDPPDGNAEAIHLEYSVNNSTWNIIKTVNPGDVTGGFWFGIEADLPLAASVTDGVYLRYRQTSDSANDIPRDVWAMTMVTVFSRGGRGAAHNTNNQTNGSGGGGGGGANGGPGETGGGGGGGVGIYGQGIDGIAGTPGSTSQGGGNGGSGGERGTPNSLSNSRGGTGGNFGGGAGSDDGPGGSGGSGAVRIIWAGTSGIIRLFPSTNTLNI